MMGLFLIFSNVNELLELFIVKKQSIVYGNLMHDEN